MESLVVVVLLASLAFFNYRYARSVLYPPFIFCSMWLLAMSLYQLSLVNLGKLHNNTLGLIAFGAVCFTLGGTLSLAVPQQFFAVHLKILRAQRRTGVWRYVILMLVVLATIVEARNTIAAAAMSGGEGNVLTRARSGGLANTDGAGSFSVFSYLAPWALYTAILFYAEIRDRVSWLAIVNAFIGAVFSTGRTFLLVLISALSCLYLLDTKKQSFKSAVRFLAWPVIGFATLWITMIFTNKDTTILGWSVGQTILNFVVGYLVGPTVGLDYVLQHLRAYGDAPHHTFKFFLSIAAALHMLTYKAPPVYDAFAPLDFPTNVYTVYKFFLTDFGIGGMFFAVLLIGFFHSLLYRKAETGSELARFLFALTIYPALMSIFDDQYAVFGSYIHAALFGAIYLRLRSHPIGLFSRYDRLRFTVLPPKLSKRVSW